MSRMRALATNLAAVASGKAVTALAGLLTVMVLTRHLGPRDFGYYRTVLTYCAFAAVLADSGLYMVTLRELSVRRTDAGGVVGSVLPLRLVSTACVLFAASAVAWVTPYDTPVKWGTLVGVLIYTCLQANDLLVAVFQSVMKQGRNALAEVAGALATLAGVWALSLTHVGALPMLGATLLGAAMALGVSWRLAKRVLPFRLTVDLAVWRRYLIIGLPLAGSQILGMAMLRGDSLLLSLFQPASAVGLYGVPAKLFELATSIPFIFAGLMMPSLTASAESNPGEFSRLLTSATDAAAVYGVGLILALVPFASAVLRLMAGPAFAAGAPALVLIAVAGALAAVSHVLRFALVACERPRLVLASDALACLCAFIAYFALIPGLSLIGAAIGTLIAESCTLAGLLRGLRRAGRRVPSFLNPAKALGVGIAAAAVMQLLAHLELPWPVALLGGGGLYLAGLALTRAIPAKALLSIVRERAAIQRTV